MKHALSSAAARSTPVIFVLLWSTGFIATKYVLTGAEPLTYLTVRMALAIAIMAVVVAIVRPRWPDRAGIGHSIVAGILVQGFYLAGTVLEANGELPD